MAFEWDTATLVALVDALRSGEFPMGYDRLVTVTEDQRAYCCLGVACEVAGLPQYVASEDNTGFDTGSVVFNVPDGFDYDGSSTALPYGAPFPFGGGTNGLLTYNAVPGESDAWNKMSALGGWDYGITLAELNDSREFSQAQLADLVQWFFVIPSQRKDALQRAALVAA